MADHWHDDPAVVLCENCTGRWLLTTQSGSTHLLDLDARTVTRVPDPDAFLRWLEAGGRVPDRHEIAWPDNNSAVNAALDDAGEMGGSALRGDADALPLLGLHPVRIGQRAALYLEVVPGIETVRDTTPVVEVRAIE